MSTASELRSRQRTKIVCTLRPATDAPGVLELARSGDTAILISASPESVGKADTLRISMLNE